MPSFLRATRAAAAAPNKRIIGGAGTSVPPVELTEPPLEVEELVLLELEELLLLDVLVLLPPKLLELDVEETLPLEVEDELPPVDVEVEAVKMVLPLLPPKKPALKKPGAKPKPGPLLPPTTTTPPPLVPLGITGGGSGIGGAG